MQYSVLLATPWIHKRICLYVCPPVSLCPSALTVRPSIFLPRFRWCTRSSCPFLRSPQMEMENKLRQRLDLQETRRQQLAFKEMRKRAEMEEEEEFRRKVTCPPRTSDRLTRACLSQSTSDCCSKLVIQIELVLSRLKCGSGVV